MVSVCRRGDHALLSLVCLLAPNKLAWHACECEGSRGGGGVFVKSDEEVKASFLRYVCTLYILVVTVRLILDCVGELELRGIVE